MRFGSRAGALGYERIERLVPPGFPVVPFQAIYRFRKKAEEGTTLYQVGSGVFSANITPPYQSWHEFKPVVKEVVRILLETRNSSEKEILFTSANLRYIDAFGNRFTEGRSTAAFMQDVLGFVVKLPTALRDEIASNSEAKPSLHLSIPLKSRQQMSLILAEGRVSGETAVIMDITISNIDPIQAKIDSVMDVFEAEHEIAHRAFVRITQKLSDVMGLVGDET